MRPAEFALEVGVRSVGLVGPGLPDWRTGSRRLAGTEPWQPDPTALPMPTVLSPSERRRAGRVLRLAVGAACDALADSTADIATVFTTSGGDGDNCHELCAALAEPTRPVSPTRFMNSVHNAAAGYFSLATKSMRATTSLCAHDGSFSAGLLEAATQVKDTGEPVLLVAYDADYPSPLREARPIEAPFATALCLAPADGAGCIAHLMLRLTAEPATVLHDDRVERLRRGIPAARALPLLTLLASRATDRCVLDYLDGLSVSVSVRPC